MTSRGDDHGGGGGDGGGISVALPDGWNATFRPIPSHHDVHDDDDDLLRAKKSNDREEGIILASIPLSVLYARDIDALRAFVALEEEDNDDDLRARLRTAATVALADYAARQLSDLLPVRPSDDSGIIIRTMGQSRRDALASGGGNDKWRRRRNSNGKKWKTEAPSVPYVLERTDCAVVRGRGEEDCGGDVLQFFLHVTIIHSSPERNDRAKQILEEGGLLSSLVFDRLRLRLTSVGCYSHVACVVLQRALRSMLQPPRGGYDMGGTTTGSNDGERVVEEGNNQKGKSKSGTGQPKYLNAVAFIADGSLLPRRSGRSSLPMSSPPAVPFESPEGSAQLTRTVTVEVGPYWRRFLEDDGTVKDIQNATAMHDAEECRGAIVVDAPTCVTMRGMIVPCGVTLIVGGGYHGKSTLLQAIHSGVYDTVPHDGRERCVSHRDAVSVRAEDGRYVHAVNVSAFIAHLPSGRSVNGASVRCTKRDTSRFGTRDASGSTSQAANVIEALESGASTLLVDEDVSAANFMARDGRMRAMIMDEPITPLLYRVNGLFLSKEHQVSTVVVVGGVGEWLDVADAVILMKDYVAYDGLEKARSVSHQFSYGHVQYAGRGVVHRLPWEVEEWEQKDEKRRAAAMMGGNVGEDESMDVADDSRSNEGDDVVPTRTLSPLRRRPESRCIANKFKDAAVHLLESGSSRLWFYGDNNKSPSPVDDVAENDGDDDDDGMVDMSKCSQLVDGGASEQLYGCGICVLWLIRESIRYPGEDLTQLLDRMERALDDRGMNGLIASAISPTGATIVNVEDTDTLSELLLSHDALDLWEAAGYAYRPRRHEVAATLTRMRGMRFDILPEKPKEATGDDATMMSEEETRRLEEESKKRALAELWANRRQKR